MQRELRQPLLNVLFFCNAKFLHQNVESDRLERFVIDSDDVSDPLVHNLTDIVREHSQEKLDSFAEHRRIHATVYHSHARPGETR